MDTCEHEAPCRSALREPWCRPCLLDLIGQQNDLNERLNADVERLGLEREEVEFQLRGGWDPDGSVGGLDGLSLPSMANVLHSLAVHGVVLEAAIKRHREQVTSWNIANREPAPADDELWAALNDDH